MDRSLEEAIRFISRELINNPLKDRSELIEKASRDFNLNPLQTDFLYNKYIFQK